jgi:hypothetical protein
VRKSDDLTGRQADTAANGSTKENTSAPVGEHGQIDQESISELIRFFKLLDKWEREARSNAEIM